MKRKASVALDTSNESNQSSSTQDNNSNCTTSNNVIVSGNDGSNNLQNGSSQNSVGPSGGGNQKIKKERADNWSGSEITALHRGIESRRHIFCGPPSQATKKNREMAWDAITKEVNAVSTTPRSLNQVMKKFKNEKCRAKRKFNDTEKDGNSMNVGNNGVTNNTPSNNRTSSGLNSVQNHHMTNANQQIQPQQQIQQAHHMTTNESMSSQTSSINVVKLAPQNVTKTMIDLPSHVQHIQMPNDDMVLIVPPEMDGLLSGIVADGSNHHHFQKCHNNGGKYFFSAYILYFSENLSLRY